MYFSVDESKPPSRHITKQHDTSFISERLSKIKGVFKECDSSASNSWVWLWNKSGTYTKNHSLKKTIFRNLSIFDSYKIAIARFLSKCTKAQIIFLAVISLFQSFSSNEKQHLIFLLILKLQIVTERTAATRNRSECSLTTHYLYLMNWNSLEKEGSTRRTLPC